MRLMSVELNNIRSYEDGKVEFPDGITLLSGDIGSGKSTLLIAIEFALFGLGRGELSGEAVLRHGADFGNVCVNFKVDSKEYSIQRTLKRSSRGIVQDKGWLETDGQRETLTASELRAKIFTILGYPLQFLAKKNLLYRFTLYTPQEEMKSILTSNDRIETIRRIFGIDAYRTIRENAQLVARSLKERQARQEELVSRVDSDISILQEKIEAGKNLLEKRSILEKEKEKTREQLATSEKRDEEITKELSALESKIALKANQQQRKKDILQDIERFNSELKRKKTLLEKSEESLSDIIKRIDGFGEIALSEEALKQQIADMQRKLELLRLDEGKVLGIIEECGHGPGVKATDICPLCKQKVPEEHVKSLSEEMSVKKEAATKKHEKLTANMDAQRKQIEQIQKALGESQRRAEVIKQKETLEGNVKQHKEELDMLRTTIERSSLELKKIPEPEDEQFGKKREDLESTFRDSKESLKRNREDQINIEKRLSQLEQEEEVFEENKNRLKELREEHEKRLAKKERDATFRTWLLDKFSPFTDLVERNVLLTIHSTFDAAFRVWFDKLVGDDSLTTSIDQEFSPVIHHIGYEVDVTHLSGGERTAVSLAYRLGLVHTIHTLLSHLGTAGLVMLDEPTEGFSTEQLSRVRDVLRDLDMDQIIIVSHEQQLEGFVDNILRVEKTGDKSILV